MLHLRIQLIFAAVARAKRGRATGLDDIPVEALTSLHVNQFLTQLFNKCFQSGLVPKDWNLGLLHPIIKDSSKDRRCPNNHRGLMLLSHISKLYSSIINYRLNVWIKDNKVLNEQQNGFIKSRSTQDHLQSFASIVETRKASKLDTFACYIDFSKAYDRIPRSLLWYKLNKIGINGNILCALQALYSNVKCQVRVNECISDSFEVTCGLKQGCLVSPTLFNLYVNDLVTTINMLDRGIKVGDKKVSLLLYADDMVLLGSCARDIQYMLDALHQWCVDWGLLVNPTKSKIMHFRNKGRKITKFPFKCGEDMLEVVGKYKYLGLWFTEFLDFGFMAEQVAASGHRALGLLIAKSKQVGGFPFQCYTKLYQSLVQSVLDYGACVWGHKQFSCISAVQHRAMRSFLGVHCKTSNTAIFGEMGWTPQFILQTMCIGRQLCRYSKMDPSRLNRQIYEWAMLKDCNAAKIHEQLLHDLDMDYMLDFNQGKSKSDVKLLKDKMMVNYIDSWKADLNRVRAKKGEGCNKLRRYRSFKIDFKTEEYLCNPSISYMDRKAFASFRCSATPLLIETGRYSNNQYLPVERRICKICNSGVEDEFHVLMSCQLYEDIRDELFMLISNDYPAFNGFSNAEKFVFIMSDCNITKYSAKACTFILQRRRNFIGK